MGSTLSADLSVADLPIADLRLIAGLGSGLAGILGPQGHFVWLSARWEPLLGLPRAALMARPLGALLHPADRPDALRAIRRLSGGIGGFQARCADVHGAWVWLEWSARRTPDGRVVCVARDVTAERSAAARRQQLLGQLHQAEALAALGHWRVDLESQGVFWSPQVFAIHGRDPAAGPPSLRDAIDFYHPDDRGAVQAALDHSVATLQPFRFELRIVRGDGVERNVACRGDVEVGPQGRVAGIFGVFQDITEERLVQERLRHIERLGTLGTLATGIAHEVNDPLTHMTHNAQLLEEQLEDIGDWMPHRQLGELTRLCHEIQTGTRRIKRIVRGLRGMAGPESGTESLVDLRLAVGKARRLSEIEWRHRAHVLVDLPDDLPHVRGDETQVQQLLLNLLVNAAHATPEGHPAAHRIRVTAGRRGGAGIWLEIQDDGAGMPPGVLARATDPFFTTKPAGGGSGLGLYLVQVFVGGLGGELRIRSKEGMGTTVRIELPGVAAPEPPACGGVAPRDPAPAAAPTAVGGVRARIFFIDDHELVARALGRMLPGHDIAVFTDPTEALWAIDGGDVPDAIFCDLMMPGMTGVEVHAALPPALQRAFWLVTGGAVTAETRRFQKEMGDRVLLKPVEPRALRERVALVLAAQTAEPTVTASC